MRMLARRLALLALALVVASAVIFAVVDLVPGDPAVFVLGTGARPDTLAALRQQLGLDLPWPTRYARWLGGVLTGDLGTSLAYKAPVAGMILDRVQVSLPLALMALGLAVAVALPVGMLAASRRGRPADALAMGAAQVGIALPNFWFAMLLVLVFAVKLRWLPAGGFPGWSDPLGALRALVLPAVALALPQAAILARVLRSALIETLGQDYIRSARAKGLSRAQVLRRHALRNSLIPVLDAARSLDVPVVLASQSPRGSVDLGRYEGGVAAAGAEDEARAERGAQHPEHRRRVVGGGRVHGDLAGEHDLAQLPGADALDGARHGRLEVLGRRHAGDPEAPRGRGVHQGQRAGAKLGDARLHARRELVGHGT